jgi:hypothetical protein
MVRGPAQRLCSGWLETCVHCKLRLEHEALLYVCVFAFFINHFVFGRVYTSVFPHCFAAKRYQFGSVSFR